MSATGSYEDAVDLFDADPVRVTMSIDTLPASGGCNCNRTRDFSARDTPEWRSP